MIISRGERVFQWVNVAFLVLVAVVALFPVLYLVSMSLTPLEVLYKYGGFRVIPPQVTLEAYKQILSTPLIPRAFMNSVIITAVGTTINLALTIITAYPLSKRRLPGRSVLTLLVTFTMMFSGGLIPSYLLVKNLGLRDTYWAVILPGAIATYNLLVMKGFFESLPEELNEAARIDGASEWRVLTSVTLPLSKPVIATLGLFYGVGHWNGFFDAMMYISDSRLLPLQVVLRNILMDAMRNTEVTPDAIQVMPGETLKMATVVIALIPVLLAYPWVQKHFTKGVLIGSIKG